MCETAATLAEELRRYCVAHPNAMDSVEGIVFWLVMQRQETTVQPLLQDVREAVELLVKEGVLIRYERPNGASVFGCSAPADTE